MSLKQLPQDVVYTDCFVVSRNGVYLSADSSRVQLLKNNNNKK